MVRQEVGTYTQNFPITYTSTPKLISTVHFNINSYVVNANYGYDVTTSGFTISVNQNLEIHFIAVGY